MTLDETRGNVPQRTFQHMKAQPIVPWTIPRLAKALGFWLMEEEHHVQMMAIKSPDRAGRR